MEFFTNFLTLLGQDDSAEPDAMNTVFEWVGNSFAGRVMMDSSLYPLMHFGSRTSIGNEIENFTSNFWNSLQ